MNHNVARDVRCAQCADSKGEAVVGVAPAPEAASLRWPKLCAMDELEASDRLVEVKQEKGDESPMKSEQPDGRQSRSGHSAMAPSPPDGVKRRRTIGNPC